MCVLQWLVWQIMAYRPLAWCAFVALAFLLARLLRLPGIILGHLLIGAAIVVLDLQWIQTEMHRPGYDPINGPDQDFVFMIGVGLRVVLINTMLLPVSTLGLKMANRARPVDD